MDFAERQTKLLFVDSKHVYIQKWSSGNPTLKQTKTRKILTYDYKTYLSEPLRNVNSIELIDYSLPLPNEIESYISIPNGAVIDDKWASQATKIETTSISSYDNISHITTLAEKYTQGLIESHTWVSWLLKRVTESTDETEIAMLTSAITMAQQGAQTTFEKSVPLQQKDHPGFILKVNDYHTSISASKSSGFYCILPFYGGTSAVQPYIFTVENNSIDSIHIQIQTLDEEPFTELSPSDSDEKYHNWFLFRVTMNNSTEITNPQPIIFQNRDGSAEVNVQGTTIKALPN